jgi:hypothetical protein
MQSERFWICSVSWNDPNASFGEGDYLILPACMKNHFSTILGCVKRIFTFVRREKYVCLTVPKNDHNENTFVGQSSCLGACSITRENAVAVRRSLEYSIIQ